MRTPQIAVCGILVGTCVLGPAAHAATLSVRDLSMAAGEVRTLVVETDVNGEATYGVTVLVEIVDRAGNIGTVAFTPGPPTDIMQLGDPWPGAGTFTAFDTHDVGFSATRNGVVDDNGTFTPSPLTFAGALAGFPIQASANASGTWDVVLSTSVGDSGWEQLATDLVAGTVTVSVGPSSIPAVSSWGLIVLALAVAITGTALLRTTAVGARL